MNQLFIFDLDGTITESLWRMHLHAQAEYDKFDSLLPEDEPNEDILEIATSLKNAGHQIIVLTGKFEFKRSMCEKVLEEIDFPYDALFMRKPGDTRQTHLVKEDILEEIIKTTNHKKQSVFIFDDRKSNCTHLYEKGYNVMLVQNR